MNRKVWTSNDYDEFEALLHEKFPKMFSQPYGGVATGPGWWDMIYNLCSTIQWHIDWKNKNAEQYPERQQPVPQVVVHQIKEKFGTLRFYVEGGDDYTNGAISMAEQMSSLMCETCGAPGERRHGGWIRVLCDEHETERQAQIAARKLS